MDDTKVSHVPWGTRARCGILLLTLLIALAGVAPIAFSVGGKQGLLAAALAWLVCLACGELAIVLGDLLRHPQLVFQYVLLTMAVRMGIPLILVMIVYLRPGPLVDGGFVYYLLAFYLLTLLIETTLSVHSLRVSSSNSAKAT